LEFAPLAVQGVLSVSFSGSPSTAMDNQEEGDFTRKQESRPEKEGAPAFVASSSSGPQPTSNQYPAAAGFQDSEDSFPFRLHQLLQDATQYGFDAIVSWTPGGTAFIVHDRDQFSTQIMHMYFAHTQFKSFQVCRRYPSEEDTYIPLLMCYVLLGRRCRTDKFP
jgi:hypothetical protein